MSEQAYKQLVLSVRRIDPAGADWMETKASKLDSFKFSDELFAVFDWKDTPQGYQYWSWMQTRLRRNNA